MAVYSIAKYKAILENQDAWIQPAFKKPQLDIVWNRDYSTVGGLFSVNTISGRVKLAFYDNAMERYFDGSWRFGTAKLVNKHGKWFLHIPCSKKFEEPAGDCYQNIVGVDLGVNFTAVAYCSDGRTIFYSGKKVKHKRAGYKAVRQQLQRRQTPSSRRRLKSIGSRENRWVQDVNHCVSKALVTSQQKGTLFVLEDLAGIRGATEKVSLKQRYVIVSWSFYDLRQKITYKAAMRGSTVVAVDPAHTSQECPACGHTKRGNRDKKLHMFHCKKCGYRSNDDRSGGMNLHRKGIEYLAKTQLTQAV